jgi:hypothetical protein
MGHPVCRLSKTSHAHDDGGHALTDGERKQVKSVSGQNRIARCEMIEPDPSIANQTAPGGTSSVAWAFAPNSPRYCRS